MKLNREILRLSVPSIISNVSVPLLGLCDTGISGHLGSELYLAAIAVGSMMLNVVFWLFGFLRMGTAGLTAGAYGAGKEDKVRGVFTRSFVLAIAIGMILITLQDPLLRVLLLFIQPEAEVRGLVENYFKICILEAPALLGIMTMSGWFVGMQSTVWPMAIAIGVNVVNMIVSILLVFHFDMGFIGVAWGTMTSNWFGLAAGLVIMSRFSSRGRFWNWRALREWKEISKFFSVNLNLFLRSFCIIAVSLGVTAAGARLGALTLAVNAVLMQFFTLFSFFVDGFAFSGEALVGRFWGAGNESMVRNSVRALTGWSVGIGVIFTAIYYFGSGWIAGMLTDEQIVREGVGEMKIWIVIIPLVSVWAFIYDGVYIGAMATLRMFCSTLVASIVFYIVVFGPWESRLMSNQVLWAAFLCYLGLRGLILLFLWKPLMHQHFKKDKSIKQ